MTFVDTVWAGWHTLVSPWRGAARLVVDVVEQEILKSLS